MAQPTGPQEGAGAYPPDPPPEPTRAAAGRDIWRETLRERQDLQATSASSDFRITSSSKTVAHSAQAYS
jgi:hypothetical protein